MSSGSFLLNGPDDAYLLPDGRLMVADVVKWQYGVKNSPGRTDGHLYLPDGLALGGETLCRWWSKGPASPVHGDVREVAATLLVETVGFDDRGVEVALGRRGGRPRAQVPRSRQLH